LGGRVPLGAGQGPGRSDRERGETGGAIGVQLAQSTIPAHAHTLNATNSPADVSAPTATTALARSTGKSAYGAATGLTNLNAGAVGTLPSGGSPHNNLMPFLVLNYCIALQGIFPQRP
jgi:microcystin-dependent protein